MKRKRGTEIQWDTLNPSQLLGSPGLMADAVHASGQPFTGPRILVPSLGTPSHDGL